MDRRPLPSDIEWSDHCRPPPRHVSPANRSTFAPVPHRFLLSIARFFALLAPSHSTMTKYTQELGTYNCYDGTTVLYKGERRVAERRASVGCFVVNLLRAPHTSRFRATSIALATRQARGPSDAKHQRRRVELCRLCRLDVNPWQEPSRAPPPFMAASIDRIGRRDRADSWVPKIRRHSCRGFRRESVHLAKRDASERSHLDHPLLLI